MLLSKQKFYITRHLTKNKMSNKCVVCLNIGDGPGYFVIPTKSKMTLRESWVKSAKLSDFFLTSNKTHKICFRHFKESDLRTDLKNLKPKKGEIINNSEITNRDRQLITFSAGFIEKNRKFTLAYLKENIRSDVKKQT